MHTGLYGGRLALLGVIVELELKKRTSKTSILRTLHRSLITSKSKTIQKYIFGSATHVFIILECEMVLHILSNALDDDEDMEVDQDAADDEVRESSHSILINSSPKIQNLLRCLHEYVSKPNEEIKGLIFVQRRHTAKIVYHVIKRYAKAANIKILTDFMVGVNAPLPESIEAILENKTNREVLKKFERNETNIIVASSVLEEGIDLQECNLVIHLDTPKSFRSYVQTKGRARMKNSEYIMFVKKVEYNALIGKIRSYQDIDKMMKEVCDIF